MLTIYNIDKLNNTPIDIPLMVICQIDTMEQKYIFNLFNTKMKKVEITLNRYVHDYDGFYSLWMRSSRGKFKYSILPIENLTTPDGLIMAIKVLLNKK